MKRSPATVPTSTRRDALKTLGVVAAFAALGGILTESRSAHAKGLVTTISENGLFAGLEGLVFAGSTVKTVGLIEHGAVAVEFADANGEVFVVDVLRFDPATPGVAQAGSLGVYMKVGRGGRRTTNEEHGLAAMHFGAELTRRQVGGARVPVLKTLRERATARDAAERQAAAAARTS